MCKSKETKQLEGLREYMCLLGRGEFERDEVIGMNYEYRKPTSPIRKQLKFRYEIYAVVALNNFIVVEEMLNSKGLSGEVVLNSVIRGLKNFDEEPHGEEYDRILNALDNGTDNFVYLRRSVYGMNPCITLDICHNLPETCGLLANEKLLQHLPSLLGRDAQMKESYREIRDGKIYPVLNWNEGDRPMEEPIGYIDSAALKTRTKELFLKNNRLG